MEKVNKVRLYGVGFKGWVEVRKGVSPPSLLEDSISTKVKSKNGYDYWTGVPRFKERDVVLRNLVWEGGEVLGCLKTDRFRGITRFSVGKGKMREIPSKFHARILKRFQEKEDIKSD